MIVEEAAFFAQYEVFNAQNEFMRKMAQMFLKDVIEGEEVEILELSDWKLAAKVHKKYGIFLLHEDVKKVKKLIKQKLKRNGVTAKEKQGWIQYQKETKELGKI